MKFKFNLQTIVHFLDSLVSLTALVVFLGVVGYGIYGIWDSSQVYAAADSSRYLEYKPTTEDRLSFEELRKINPDVFGWITIYGTNIDYPLLKCRSNDDYINTDVFGQYSLSGAIFLDYSNDTSFGDFESIIYGHHMDQDKMFGNIDKFAERDFFDTHKYGNLFYDGIDHGLEIFSYIECDAYDNSIYGNYEAVEKRNEFLSNIKSYSKYYRDINADMDDHLVLLSTCDYSYTNGRMVIIARINDETYEDSFSKK
jgi:sortase B